MIDPYLAGLFFLMGALVGYLLKGAMEKRARTSKEVPF